MSLVESTICELNERLREQVIPAQHHSPTSVAAAQSIEPCAKTQRALVLNYLKGWGPATDEEMQTMLNMNPSTQRPRRVELCKAGKVIDSGKTRATKSGRQATVWTCNT